MPFLPLESPNRVQFPYRLTCFLLGCGQKDLEDFELGRLAEVANLRKELHDILDRVIDAMSQAALASWFKSQDRQRLKAAIDNEESPIEYAKRMVREGQRSDEELLPLPSLAPGAAHLAAALRYQKRNTMGVPPESAATALHAVQAAILKFLPTSEAVAVKENDLFAMIDIPSRGTARNALMDLLKAGKIQRIGQSVSGHPFRYFTAQNKKPRQGNSGGAFC